MFFFYISSITVYLNAFSYIIFERAFHETMVSLATNFLSFQLRGARCLLQMHESSYIVELLVT